MKALIPKRPVSPEGIYGIGTVFRETRIKIETSLGIDVYNSY
jgi:hypothetical protein